MLFLSKMVVEKGGLYRLGELELSELLDHSIELEFTGVCRCQGCSKEGKIKLYGDGYCGKCIKTLARCDLCIVKPELCHFDSGTCREPEWGDQHCNQPHIVYLANTSAAKVGITRVENIPSRWLDQGATQALPIIRVSRRYHSGLVEKLLAQFIDDKTNWRAMLQGDGIALDLVAVRDQLFEKAGMALDDLEDELDGLEFLDDEKVQSFSYPVLEYPSKITSLSFDKKPIISGRLKGIKGQYLILDSGVLNIRKHSGYGVIFRSDV